MNTSGGATSSGLRALERLRILHPDKAADVPIFGIVFVNRVAWSPLNTDSYTVMDAIVCATPR